MNLTDEQKNSVRQWLEEGASVADVQNRLSDEFKVSMTYMDVRFLLDDLKATPVDPAEEQPEAPDEPTAEAPPEVEDTPTEEPKPVDAEAELVPDDAPAGEGGGKATVTIDEIVRPGAMASGKVTFSDNKTCTWYIDQFGRPGLVPPEEGYQPKQEDIMAFQQELHSVLSRAGI